MRVYLTGTELKTKSGIELLEICQQITADGDLQLEEIIKLRKWLRHNSESGLPGAKYLHNIMERIAADKHITTDEKQELHLAIESVIPKRLRHATTVARKKVRDQKKERQRLRKAQLEAKRLKIPFDETSSREELEALISCKYRTTSYKDLPPNEEQLAFAKKIGVKLGDNWTYGKFDNWIEANRSHPTYGPRIRKLLETQRLEDAREMYGDQASKYLRWEDIVDAHGTYAIIVKRGKKIVTYVAEFEDVDVEFAKTPYVKVDILLPKKYREYGETMVDMEKEATLDTRKILHVQKLKSIDIIIDGKELASAKDEAEQITASFLISNP